jgi:lipoprotein LpqH
MAVKKNLLVVVGLLIVAGSIGCSSRQAALKPKPDVLPPGNARLTVNDGDPVATTKVQCATVEHLTTIKIGDQSTVATAMVSNADQLSALWVRIHDVDGFLGSYDYDLAGSARVTMVESTYQILGTAEGFNTGKPSESVAEKFALQVSC